MTKISYRRHRFPPEISQHAAWLYFRFPLSFRDVEDLLAESGIEASYETLRRWSVNFGLAYASRLRRSRPRRDTRWHLDELFVSINGRRMYLRQAAILWRRTKRSRVIKMARLRRQEEQPGREFSLAGSTARATNATVQVARISATVSVHSRRRLQHLQYPTPFDFPQDTTPNSQRGDECMANCDDRSVSTMAIPNSCG